jgi:hypothetical protein
MPRIRSAISCPPIGRLVKYRPPAEASHDGVTVRNDTGVQEAARSRSITIR